MYSPTVTTGQCQCIARQAAGGQDSDRAGPSVVIDQHRSPVTSPPSPSTSVQCQEPSVQHDSSAGKQPLGCPQEEDEADQGGDGEVQGGVRGHGQEAPG